MELHAKYSFFAEGSRGHLGRQLFAKYPLQRDADPQVYGIGLKELWEVKAERHQPGLVVHSAGWPLDAGTYGGSFSPPPRALLAAAGVRVAPRRSEPQLAPSSTIPSFQAPPARPPASWG